jgi:dihydroneopterin aldolase
MDTVFIEGLRVDTVIGAYAWERDIRQPLRLDLEMTFDCRAAGASDALADALDYHRVATAVTALVEASRCELLEALAERVAAMVLHDFPVTRLRLSVRKPGAVGNADTVGVVIERGAAA